MNVCPPRRAAHSYVQHLIAAPASVFPLLCPVREAEWVEGWAPSAVWSQCGVVEPDCVFLTPGEPADAIWYVTRHEPAQWFVEMLKITPGLTACRLQIQLADAPGGCTATVRYQYTSLSDAGDRFVESFTEAYYQDFMRGWEAALNHYLGAHAAPA